MTAGSASTGPLTRWEDRTTLLLAFVVGAVPSFATVRRRSEPWLSIQPAGLGDLRPLGAVAALAWCALLVLGIRALFSATASRPVRVTLGLTLAGQTLLALVYGTETFLYALNFAVLIVVMAGLATTTRLRPAALALAVVAVLAGAVNNYSLRSEAVARAAIVLRCPVEGDEQRTEALGNPPPAPSPLCGTVRRGDD